MVNKFKSQIDKLIDNLMELAEEWEIEIKSSSELKRLITTLDNELIIKLLDDGFKIELWINSGHRSANADKFFYNHSWCVRIGQDTKNSNNYVLTDVGLCG